MAHRYVNKKKARINVEVPPVKAVLAVVRGKPTPQSELFQSGTRACQEQAAANRSATWAGRRPATLAERSRRKPPSPPPPPAVVCTGVTCRKVKNMEGISELKHFLLSVRDEPIGATSFALKACDARH